MQSKLFSTVALALSLLASVTLPTNAQADCAREYTVQAGDNCDTIGALQHVSTFQLHFVNTAINADCTNLAVGQILCLGVTGEDCQTTAVVQTGDTCPSIEATARISDDTFKANNPNINADCSNIRFGEVVCTAFQVFSYTQQF